ncbi:MAG: tyrosine-type recombinase/integrase [Acidimicrobiales bacterium]
MASLGERVGARVERVGEHQLWTGAKDRRGAGVISVGGRLTTVRRVVWELERGPLPTGAKLLACPVDAACVRVDHLCLQPAGARASVSTGRSVADSLPSVSPPTPAAARAPAGPRRRSRQGGGSLRELRPGTWELAVSAGRYGDGRSRRAYRTVRADTEREAVAHLADFVAEVSRTRQAETTEMRDLSVDQAVERFLDEHLRAEMGREEKTVSGYRLLHGKWFSPSIGKRRLRDVDEATIDRLFGAMRAAGLSRSRLHQAKSLYAPLFRWAKRRGIVVRNPMVEFQLPTTRHVVKERTPPEVEELCLLLHTAVEVVPEVAPVLVLGAVTGMRRGELVAVRASCLDFSEGRIRVESAVSETKQVKGTKTRVERSLYLDAETLDMLARHGAHMAERAAAAGAALTADPYVFSLALDCSAPMPPDYVTRRVAVLKEQLGIEDRAPEAMALEDQALGLYRRPAGPRRTRSGPAPRGGLSYRDIGAALGRSDRWAAAAVASAQRREAARAAHPGLRRFDGSILALRRFTSSELLDAGFNISMVAQRQGHGPGVLARHYAKSRRSADRQAADHLGRVVHGPSSVTQAS